MPNSWCRSRSLTASDLQHIVGDVVTVELGALLRGIYADPTRCPVGWMLLRERLEYLTSEDIAEGARLRAEAVEFDPVDPRRLAEFGH